MKYDICSQRLKHSNFQTLQTFQTFQTFQTYFDNNDFTFSEINLPSVLPANCLLAAPITLPKS